MRTLKKIQGAEAKEVFRVMESIQRATAGENVIVVENALMNVLTQLVVGLMENEGKGRQEAVVYLDEIAVGMRETAMMNWGKSPLGLDRVERVVN